MSGFKSYKIRDGVHIPSEKYKENWNAIFGKKPKKPTNGGLMGKCKTCDDKYFINSNDKNGNDEIQKCDDCNYFKSDKEAQNHQKT